MSNGIAKGLSGLWTAIWFVSVYAWLNNVVHEMQAGRYGALIILLVVLGFAVVLFLVEGLEIAFGDLRDKDVDQFNDRSTGVAVKEIQKHSDFFFSQRQVFSVTIISFISILISSNIESFYVYGYGSVHEPLAGILNFIFINVLILCACQVAPKRLAIVNSERFLSQSKMMWPVIKWVGWLNIPGPSDIIVRFLKKVFGYKERQLLPSRASHYNSSALINGHCNDLRSISIKLYEDGSADISRLSLLLFLHGRRKTISGRTRVGPGNSRILQHANQVLIHSAWCLPIVEDLRPHEACFDGVFAEALARRSTDDFLKARNIEPFDLMENAEIGIATTGASLDDPDWTITSLDGWPEDLKTKSGTAHMLCVLFEITAKAPAGSFFIGSQDSWVESISPACRKLSFSIEPATKNVRVSSNPSCKVGTENIKTALTEESARAMQQLQTNGYIPYPVQSAVYEFSWSTLLRI
ncbi:MAG: hypothetical protein HYX38_00795 [Rhodospirillales bacterium]|nr:hypothetical protein [Rhodospirillales bacterium]